MFWVALATAIMMLSGEGDDTRAILALLGGLRAAITQTVDAGPRRSRALDAVTRFERAFETHRALLKEFGACVEAADRKYGATRDDYAACSGKLEAGRPAISRAIEEAQRSYDDALDDSERERIAEIITGLPDAWVLDPTLDAQPHASAVSARRFRGLEGVAAQRHLTLPRNVVGLVYGPLGPATFGQRYPSKVIDGGTSYRHERWAGADASEPTTNEWFTRFGVRFGLFDDIEAAALFLPFELAPDFRFDSVTVALTDQLRLEDLDVGLRFSFQTPGDTGWAVAPGVTVGHRGRRLALQAGALVPMEVGSFKERKPARFGFFAPARLTYNLLPSVFVTADSGLAHDDFDHAETVSVPLGFGAGYTLLAGSRLVEFTASFTWDDFLVPGRPNGMSAFQPAVFRTAFGASMYFQAL